MRKTFLRVAVIATLLSLATCNLIEPKPQQEPAEIKPATGPAPAPKPTVTLARPDNREDALAAHKQALRKRGTALSDEEVGYYMDIHEARFIQLVRDDRVGMLRQGDSIALVISGSASFASSSARLRPEIHGVLNVIAKVLEEYRDTRIIISGHTDDAGEADYNQQLSERRARSVSRFFIQTGVALDRIVIVGYGESLPIADNKSAKGQATNRRIEVLLEPLTHQEADRE